MQSRWLVPGQHQHAAERGLDDHRDLRGSEQPPEPGARAHAPPAPCSPPSGDRGQDDRDHAKYEVDALHLWVSAVRRRGRISRRIRAGTSTEIAAISTK